MERQYSSHLSQKSIERMNKIHQACFDVNSLSPSEAEHTLSPARTDSGYSTDVESFESPMAQMSSIDESVSLEEYKMQIDEALREYFLTNDVMELIHCIEELDAPLFGYEAVMRAISLSLDRESRERELVSRFFAVGSGRVLSAFALEKGFERTFERIGDLQLDCPNVKEYLSRFLARAIADEVFPPRILESHILKRFGADVLRGAEDLLNVPHSLELLEHVWGAGAASLDELNVMKQLVRDAITEYFSCHDIDECLRCMDELHSPYYMHEFVKKVIEIAMDGNARRQELAVSLLAEACKREVVPHHQLILGIRRVKKGLPELLLDVPLDHR